MNHGVFRNVRTETKLQITQALTAVVRKRQDAEKEKNTSINVVHMRMKCANIGYHSHGRSTWDARLSQERYSRWKKYWSL